MAGQLGATGSPAGWVRTSFDRIAGWSDDDHPAAFSAFQASARVLLSRGDADAAAGGLRSRLCSAMAAAVGKCELGERDAKAFFEAHFQPWWRPGSSDGLATGYFEIALPASRVRSARFPIPLYGRPDDLVEIHGADMRGALNGHQLTHVRRLADGGTAPFWTRAEIEDGALDGRAPAICYLENAVDGFLLHVQGSGVLTFEDGAVRRVTYDGKNGHPYVSVGRSLIDDETFKDSELTLETMVAWLKDDAVRAADVLSRNPSYVFFKMLGGCTDGAARGVFDIPLTPRRSLAVDASVHPVGSPVFLAADTLDANDDGAVGFRQLMVAQDVGSAIQGPERCDIYFGSGEHAGRLAGRVKHPCQLVVLRPTVNGDRDSEIGKAP